jgi:TetR/AcrR family transcriptional regulator, repressor for neighboring sulfatase
VPRITKAPRKPRSRLSAEQAHATILDATERRLLEVGPQGLRLQDIARDVGISHPTILHHFGSREELVDAVARRAVTKLQAELLGAFTDIDADAGRARSLTHRILERVDQVLRRHGHARLLAWLVLSKLKTPEKSLLRDMAVAVHAAWKVWGKNRPFEEAQFAVMLTSAATFGLALLDRELYSMTGLPSDDKVRERFRDWLADVMTEQMSTRR